MTSERYAITLESVAGHDTALDARLKAAFKVLLRGFGLRIVEARELSLDAPDSTQTRPSEGPLPNDGTKPKRRRKAKTAAVGDDTHPQTPTGPS